MRLHNQFIIFSLIILSSNSFHFKLNHKRQDDSSYDIFMSENEDEIWPLAISSVNDMSPLAGEDSLFQGDLEHLAANSGVGIAQGSSCGQPWGKRDISESELIWSNQPSFSRCNERSLMTRMIMKAKARILVSATAGLHLQISPNLISTHLLKISRNWIQTTKHHQKPMCLRPRWLLFFLILCWSQNGIVRMEKFRCAVSCREYMYRADKYYHRNSVNTVGDHTVFSSVCCRWTESWVDVIFVLQILLSTSAVDGHGHCAAWG